MADSFILSGTAVMSIISDRHWASSPQNEVMKVFGTSSGAITLDVYTLLTASSLPTRHRMRPRRNGIGKNWSWCFPPANMSLCYIPINCNTPRLTFAALLPFQIFLLDGQEQSTYKTTRHGLGFKTPVFPWRSDLTQFYAKWTGSEFHRNHFHCYVDDHLCFYVVSLVPPLAQAWHDR